MDAIVLVHIHRMRDEIATALRSCKWTTQFGSINYHHDDDELAANPLSLRVCAMKNYESSFHLTSVGTIKQTLRKMTGSDFMIVDCGAGDGTQCGTAAILSAVRMISADKNI
jgi:hypothetical protein